MSLPSPMWPCRGCKEPGECCHHGFVARRGRASEWAPGQGGSHSRQGRPPLPGAELSTQPPTHEGWSDRLSSTKEKTKMTQENLSPEQAGDLGCRKHRNRAGTAECPGSRSRGADTPETCWSSLVKGAKPSSLVVGSHRRVPTAHGGNGPKCFVLRGGCSRGCAGPRSRHWAVPAPGVDLILRGLG